MKIDDFLTYFDGVDKVDNNQWMAKCPAHDDEKASLAISTGKSGSILIHCHADCDKEDVLEAVGLSTQDLFPGKQKRSSSCKVKRKRRPEPLETPTNVTQAGEIVAEYDYRDESRERLFQVVRFEPKDFRQRRPNGQGGWTWKLGDVRRVLYRLPELLTTDPSKTVYLVEGEKDVDRLRSLNLVATCNVGGAGKWKPEYSEHLAGRKVVIIPDNDDPGRKHANMVAKALQGIATSIKVLSLPDLPEKGDVSDWLDAGGTAKELRNLATDTPEWKASAQPMEHRKTDLANAERFVEKHGSDIRYCAPWRKWLVWDGKRWKIDDTLAIQRLAEQTVVQWYVDASKIDKADRHELVKWARRSESRCAITNMIELSKSKVPITPDQLDTDPWKLNVSNGTLDLKTGEFLAHCRNDFITKMTAVEYDPNTQCRKWCQFLNDIFLRDAKLIDYVQMLLGYCLTGDVSEQIMPVFWGTGQNGKSTLIVTIQQLLGSDYATTAPRDFLMMKKFNDHPTEIASLHGMRFVVAAETEDRRRLSEGFVKQLTGGDRLKARRMKEDFWEFNPTHKLVLVTNHKPEIRGTDKGIWRRIVLILFNYRVPDDRKDGTLPEKLRAELPGILAWCVRGCRKWQMRGNLRMPETVAEATASYQSEQDQIERFIAERCLREGRENATQLFTAYERWAKKEHVEAFGQTRFGNAMREKGFDKKKSNGVYYLGIRLQKEYRFE